MALSPQILKRVQELAAAEFALEENPNPAMAAYVAEQKRQLLAGRPQSQSASRKNAARIRRATTVLDTYAFDLRSNINELLLDLQALCRAKDIDFEEVIAIACRDDL